MKSCSHDVNTHAPRPPAFAARAGRVACALLAWACACLCIVAPAALASVDDDPNAAAQGAVEFLKKRVAEHPTDPSLPTRLAAAYLDLAKRTADVELYAHADTACAEALKRDPKNVPAMLVRGSLRLAQHRFREAVESAEQALALRPDAPEALSLRADALLQLGRLTDARADYQKLLDARKGDPIAHVRMAHLHVAANDAEAARASFQEAVAAAEKSAPPPGVVAWCLVRAGEFYFRTGDWDEAARAYGSAVELSGDDPDVLDHLAELHAARNEYEQALAFSQRALALSPRPEFEHARGDILAAMGRADEALACHEKALAGYLRAATAGHAHYYHHLAGLYCDVEALRDPEEALRWARRDLQVRRTPSTLDAMAWALYHAGQYAEASLTMDKALLDGTLDSHILYHAGLVYSRAGDAKKSRIYLRRAAGANPKFNEFHFHR